MSGGVLAGIIAGLAGLIVTGVLHSLLAREVEGWIESLPGFLLRMARARVPSSQRDLLYDEWVAELHEALHGTEARPLTRLVLGTRYAAGLLYSARRVADELGPARQSPGADPAVDKADEPAAPAAAEGPLLSINLENVPSSSDGPTVLRVLLGSHLRRLREARGITARQAAAKIRASESKISRIELGRNAIREIDVLDLLTLYGVGGRMLEQLLALAEQSNRPGWWHRYNDILPDWFQAYVGMEEAARSIRVYEAQFIPGLLQTEDYATAVISLGDFPLEQAERLVVLRKERQRRFRNGKLKLWVILDEAALRRPVAGTDVQIAQLRYLREACASPALTLQVIPYGAGGHAAPTGFSILRFIERDLPDVVYVENLTSALYLDKQADVDRYLLAMDRMSVVAYEPHETPRILDEIIRQLASRE